MLELTPELIQKFSRFNELKKDPAADVNEAIDIYIEIAGTISGVSALDREHTSDLINILKDKSLTEDQERKLSEVCLHGLATLNGNHDPYIEPTKVAELASFLIERKQGVNIDLSSERI